MRHFGASLFLFLHCKMIVPFCGPKKKEAGVKQLLLWSMPLMMAAMMMMMKDLVNE